MYPRQLHLILLYRPELTWAQRNFKFITMLGFASTVMASWEFILP